MLPIIACGINHKTAPVALREQVTFPPERIALYLNDLAIQENIREAVLLSTCNRTELYCIASNVEKVTDWFCRQHSLTQAEILPLMYVHRDEAAIVRFPDFSAGVFVFFPSLFTITSVKLFNNVISQEGFGNN